MIPLWSGERVALPGAEEEKRPALCGPFYFSDKHLHRLRLSLFNFFPIANDAIVLGLLVGALGLVFYTACPLQEVLHLRAGAAHVLLIPAALNSLGVVNGKTSTSSLRGTCCPPA